MFGVRKVPAISAFSSTPLQSAIVPSAPDCVFVSPNRPAHNQPSGVAPPPQGYRQVAGPKLLDPEEEGTAIPFFHQVELGLPVPDRTFIVATGARISDSAFSGLRMGQNRRSTRFFVWADASRIFFDSVFFFFRFGSPWFPSQVRTANTKLRCGPKFSLAI